jgi:glucose/arabinose dehydrogenase
MIPSNDPTIAPWRLYPRGITSQLCGARTRHGRDTRARAHGSGGSTTRRALSLLLLVGLCTLPMNAHELAVSFTEFPVATGLTGPTAAEATGDGRLFVAQQDGIIRVIKDDTLLAEPFAALSVESSGGRGVLGITLDPAFDSNQFVYVYYTAPLPVPHNRLSRFTALGDLAVPGSEVVLFELPAVGASLWHMGGAIQFGPDGKLYVPVGDHQAPANAQLLTVPMGKILRVNADGTIPTDNPFYGQTTGVDRAIWALGLRNPYSTSFQPGTGRFFINDVGQETFAEINEGAAGANFGWPTTEGAFRTSSHPQLTPPVYAYPHGDACAITGGAFYNPIVEKLPDKYRGKYFFVDFCSAEIGMLDPDSGTAEQFHHAAVFPTDLLISPGGDLYYLSRGGTNATGDLGTGQGAVYKIEFATDMRPTIVTQPEGHFTGTGQSATFSVGVSGTGPFQYQWQRNGVNIPGATDSSYTLASTTVVDDTVLIRCLVTNAYGNALSDAAELRVNPEPATGRATVRALPLTPIPNDEWDIWFVNSEEIYAGDFSAAKAIDNDPTTIWHSAYHDVLSPPPHDIQIDLRRMYALGGLRYLPRTDGSHNGRVAQYEVYVSADGAEWGDPVATGSFVDSHAEQEALFATTTTGRYIRFHALGEVNGNPWTSVAELNVLGAPVPPEGTLALHASNRHYLQLGGRPTIVIGSGEHYGALINLDFDYAQYFATLGSSGLNHTRLWMGPYREASGHFGLFDNTLAPAPGRWIVPWARSATPGGPDGNKFDLDQWDPEYFARLHSLIAAAAANDVVVEINLFCVYYEEDMWGLSPFNPDSNVNGVTGANRSNALSVSNGSLMEYQRRYVEKLVSELNGYDNIYYEIVNEPYSGSTASDEFQSEVVQWIVETEASLPKKHLIAVNGPWATAAQPHGAVSIYNMHYTAPGEISGALGFDGVIGNNETGFRGTSDATYRKDAWHYLLHGAGLYSMLDFSFHVGFEDGTFVNSTRSGGGSKALRDQLVVLKQFIETFDFVRMAPDTTVVESGAPELWSAFSEPGEQYAIFLDGGPSATLSLALPAGTYWAEWVNTRTGSVMQSEAFTHTMGSHSLVVPRYSQDIALRIKRD